MDSSDVQPSMIDAVILDFGGVVIDWNMRHLFRTVFDDQSEMEHFLATVLTPAENLRCDLGVPIAQVVAELCERHPDHTEALVAWRDRWIETVPSAMPGMPELIRDLRSAGLAVYGLSNFSAETFALARDRHETLGAFDGIVLSAEEGVAKPQPEIFHRLFERYGVDPGRAVFVDDAHANVEAGRALGLLSVLFAGADDLRTTLAGLGIAGL